MRRRDPTQPPEPDLLALRLTVWSPGLLTLARRRVEVGKAKTRAFDDGGQDDIRKGAAVSLGLGKEAIVDTVFAVAFVPVDVALDIDVVDW